MWKLVSIVAAVWLLSVHALAGQVRLVTPTGTQNFSEIQPAVDAATQGALILVAPGAYSRFTIQAKSVSVVAVDGIVSVNGAVGVYNTASPQAVLLSGLRVQGAAVFPGSEAGLNVNGNAGLVRIQDCEFQGQDGDWYNYASPGARLSGNSQLSFERSTFRGGKGEFHIYLGDPGAAGADSNTSQGTFEECVFTGGEGGGSEDQGGDGGAGLLLNGGPYFLSGTSCIGGDGGDAAGPFMYIGGNGGAGLVGGTGNAVGCTFAGGAGGFQAGSNGIPFQSSIAVHSGPARTLRMDALDADGVATVSLQVRGAPGDRVHPIVGVASVHTPSPNPLGTQLVVGIPLFRRSGPLGVIPASGVLNVQMRLPEVAPGSQFVRYFVQALVVPATGNQSYLTGANTLHLFNRDAGPDCDGNGVQDYVDVAVAPIADCNHTLFPDPCDIASGTSQDLDGNGVPDECGGFIWHVDALAPPGGNGSSQAPFQSIGQGIAAASNAHTILVRDGLYTGPSNRDLSFGSRQILLRSLNGPANCVIDCQGLGKAIDMQGNVPPVPSRISGFTFRNGIEPNLGFGGAIELRVCNVVLDSCRFENCTASNGFGGAVAIESSQAIVRDCDFVGNQALYGGALRITTSAISHAQVVRCRFEDNSASVGGAMLAQGSIVPIEISHCTFLTNVADPSQGLGGAIDGTLLRIQHCLFAGNRAVRGGAVTSWSSAGWADLTTLRDCTFVANYASQSGSVLAAAWVTVRDCVLWNNSSPSLTHDPQTGHSIDIAWSDLMGGAASTVGNIVLGAGMIDAHPHFVDADGPDNIPNTYGDNDYRLGLTSPCLDAADNAAVGLDFFDLDQDGNTGEHTPFDLAGFPRFVDIPTAPDTGSGTAPLVDMGCFERQP